MSSFSAAKNQFDDEHRNVPNMVQSLVPVDGHIVHDIPIRNKNGELLEEYYKWQFIYSLTSSGLYSKDYIGVEVFFPKGNKNSAPIKIDACIFDDKDWIKQYLKWRTLKDDDAVEWLRKHLICSIEFKKEDSKDIKTVFIRQVTPYMKEAESSYVLGFYYDKERLYIFQRKNGQIVRYDESKNQNGDKSNVSQLSLDLTDGYAFIPTFEDLKKRINKFEEIDRSKRVVDDLDVITGLHSIQINTAISNILKVMTELGLLDQRGYQILIQVLAMKIFDEKRSLEYKKYLEFYATQKEVEKFHLMFYIKDYEKNYVKLSDKNIQEFIKRMINLFNETSEKYALLVDSSIINWKTPNHVKCVSAMVENFQDYSFIRSSGTDLYQLIFYRFANEFTKAEKGQFLTPLQIIDFLVKIVSPKGGEKIIDPTVGIADFLSKSYVNSKGTLDDKNFYGIDNDEKMVMLSELNMLLNGDGNATIKYVPDKGSILSKFNNRGDLVELDTYSHANGNWDNWLDQTKLMKFDVVLTNPPFGEDRKFQPKTDRDEKIAGLYELWNIARVNDWIDYGLIFLENAYRILNTNGRMGIVLSNSLASIDRWEKARNWLMDKMRIVALFDLPQGLFAESGVNTTLVVAYKPEESELAKLKSDNYEIFVRDIKNVGYEIRTLKRVKFYNPLYRINESTFEIEMDNEGNPLMREDFTQTIKDFKSWINTQEETLKKIFE